MKDIKTSQTLPLIAQVGDSASLDGLTYFLANASLDGLQLWRSDGTEVGTGLVANLGGNANPARLRVFLGALYFTILGQTQILELWKSDGTVAGTKRLKALNGFSSTSLVPFKGELYFSTYLMGLGSQIWKSDGTAEGTRPVVELQGTTPRELIPVGDLLFFLAPSNNLSQTEGLWRSDGTSSGTFLLADFVTVPFGDPEFGGGRLGPNGLVDFGGIAFFVANDGVSGDELWRSDGTLSGTAIVKDIDRGPAGGFVSPSAPPPANAPAFQGRRLLPFGGEPFFAAVDPVHGFALWKSDGTGAGTVPVKSINPSPPAPSTSFNPSPLFIAVGPYFFFQANDGVSGSELWRSDGTEIGTLLVRDIFPGTQGSDPSRFGAAGGRVFFSSSDPDHGRELWVSDGTNTGTTLVADVLEGPDSSSPIPFAEAGGELLFTATDRTGSALWRTNGRPEGTVRIRTFFPPGSHPANLIDANQIIYFTAFDETGVRHLWKSDGTPDGTQPVTDVRPAFGFSDADNLVLFKGFLYFPGPSDISGAELWRTDGSPQGTSRVEVLGSAIRLTNPSFLTVVGDSLYLEAAGTSIWRINGSESGARLFRSAGGSNLTNVAGSLYFTSGFQLLKSDGTEIGTLVVRDFFINGATQLTAVGNRLYFINSPADLGGSELWTSDGTEAGTFPLRRIGFANQKLVAKNNDLYFTIFGYGQDAQVWKTDGTVQGTVMIYDLLAARFVGDTNKPLPAFVASGGILYFIVLDQTHGTELWKSDGTMVGTALVKDIGPGPAGSSISALTDVGGVVVFAADDGVHGKELWRSDGTEAGTYMVQDIAAGPLSSFPGSFRRAGDVVYFSADDGITGTELWAIARADLDRPPRRPLDSPRILEFRH